MVFREKYVEKNRNQLKLNNYNFKTMLTELVEPKEEIYSHKKYPYFKYFKLTKYKTEEDFFNKMPNKEKYALTNLLLSKFDELNKLQYLPLFNKFNNFMVEEYSYKISREDAKKRKLKDEKIYKDENFKNKSEKFFEIWNENLKNEATRYECGDDMKIKSLSSNDELIYFLNDIREKGNGMYLAAAYNKFIEWQNSFILPIIDANSSEGILHDYIDCLKKKIPIQESKLEQIKDSKYTNLKDIIYSFSERNIFSFDDKINYSDYNLFTYDYDSIEEEIGRILLPGICLFDNEKNLNFVTYLSEGFLGEKSDIISIYYLKYKQKDFTIEEKNNIKNYIKKLNKSHLYAYGKKYDFNEFLSSL